MWQQTKTGNAFPVSAILRYLRVSGYLKFILYARGFFFCMGSIDIKKQGRRGPTCSCKKHPGLPVEKKQRKLEKREGAYAAWVSASTFGIAPEFPAFPSCFSFWTTPPQMCSASIYDYTAAGGVYVSVFGMSSGWWRVSFSSRIRVRHHQQTLTS